jgi:hypothetical protein
MVRAGLLHNISGVRMELAIGQPGNYRGTVWWEVYWRICHLMEFENGKWVSIQSMGLEYETGIETRELLPTSIDLVSSPVLPSCWP